MFAANQDSAHSSISRLRKGGGGEILEQLAFIGYWLGFCHVFHWRQDGARRNATMRERALQRAECHSAMVDSSFSRLHREVMKIEGRRLL